MDELTEKKCKPCEGGVSPLKGEALLVYAAKIPSWKVTDEHHLVKAFTFEDYVMTVNFINQVAALSEEEGHHPNISFTWGKAEIKLYTHSIDGLSENDFILAAKIDMLLE